MGEYLISLSLLIAVVLLLRGVFKKHVSPRVIYALWLVVVLRLCLPFSFFEIKLDLPDYITADTVQNIQSLQAVESVPSVPPDAFAESESDAAPYKPDEHFADQSIKEVGTDADSYSFIIENENVKNFGQTFSPESPESPAPAVSAAPALPVSKESPNEQPIAPFEIDWSAVILVVWACGTAVVALWFIISGVVFNHLLKSSRKLYKRVNHVRIFTTSAEGAPCLAGILPSIYITPEAAENKSQTLIIEHEYTHLRHGDHIWALIRIIALALHWWNPLVWAAAFVSKHDAELACDDAVSAKLDASNRLAYAHIIIDTIPQKHRHAVGLGSEPMKERIIRLTKKQRNSIICVILALALTVCAVGCAFSSVTDTDSDAPDTSEDIGSDTSTDNTSDTSGDIDGNESACDELYGDYLNGELTMTELMQYKQVRSEASAMINGLLRALESQSENGGIFDPSMISDVELSDPDAYSFTYTDSQTADAFSVNEGDTHPYRFTLPIDDEQTLVIAFDVNSDGMHPTKLWSEFKAVDINSNGTFVDDITSLIDKNLDILMSGGEFELELQYVKANPKAFDAIIALGEDAVPYLEKLADEYFKHNAGSLEQRRCALAMYIHNQIDPVYDVVSVSPDGKYSLRLYAESFIPMWTGNVGVYYSKAAVTDSASGNTVCRSELYYNNPRIVWSDDSRYAALSHGNQKYLTEIQLFDTQSGNMTELPLMEIADMIEAESKIPVRSRIYSWHLSVDEWGDDTVKIRVDALLGAASDGVFMSASYTYDLTSGKVTALSYNIEGEEPRTIPEIIDSGLDVIMSHYGEFDNEAEYAKAELDAFYGIIWLDKSALPYLKEIYENYSEYDSGSKEQLRCFMAMYAANKIDAKLFNAAAVSPDGKYTLKADADSFFALSSRGGVRYTSITLYDAKTGEKLMTLNRPFYGVGFIWSDDGKYAIIDSSSESGTSTLSLIITANRKCISLPHSEMFDAARAKLDGAVYLQSLHTAFDKWVSDSSVKVNVSMHLLHNDQPLTVTGTYVYNIPKRQLETVELDGLPVTVPASETVDSALDALVKANTDHNGRIIDTTWKHEDYINANPDAFECITKLGNSALSYLKTINENTFSYGIDTAEHVRCLLARAAIHAIYPDYYDYTAVSPDGKHMLSFTITDFFDVSAPVGERSLGYMVSLENAVDGSVIAAADKEFAFTANPVNIPSAVTWSENGKYVFVTSGIAGKHLSLDMFDIERGTFIELPDAAEIKLFLDSMQDSSDV